jgi:eukaryotic-like serine/threonine-protein kinase
VEAQHLKKEQRGKSNPAAIVMTDIPDGAPVAVVAGRYRLRELVGTGGMGAVWRAGDELLGREVALKQVRLAGQPAADVALARERTMREARIAALLHHPHIVSIFDVVVERGEPWLVLEFLPSRSLGSVLAEHGTLPPVEVAAIGADVADALAAAHAAGIVHRDVKPDNVLLSKPSTAGPVVKLTDFGIAHTAAAPAITATHVLTGTPAYFAPETARGEGTDARTDVYSLGATLYAAVEGHPPFGTDDGNVLELLAKIMRGGAPVSERAGPLAELLRRLTADDPAARPTAAQARAALRRIAGARREPAVTLVDRTLGGPSHADAQGPDPATPRGGEVPRRGLRVAAAVATVLAVAAAIVVAVVISRPGAAPAGPPSVAAPTTAALDTATIPDPATADPCSLIDIASLQGFGTVTLDPDNIVFAGCSADIERPNGIVAYNLFFENEVQVRYFGGDTREEHSGYTVVNFEPSEDFCEQRILLADGNAVRLSAKTYEDPTGGTDLCAIVNAGRESTVGRLVEQGIGRRARLDETFPLAGIPACGLLTAEELATAVANPSPPRPRFADWGCDWASLTGGGSVEVAYYRGPVWDNPPGSPAVFADHPGWVIPGPGDCSVEFVQRIYSAGGSDRIEGAWVVYQGEGDNDQLCQKATSLATAAARRLPPPS